MTSPDMTSRDVAGTDVTFRKDVAIPFAAGIDLRADVYGPADGAPRPVLLQYTAYNKANWLSVFGVINPLRAVAAGFAVVVADALGRFASDDPPDGPYRPFRNDGEGAAACIEWIAAQPWCDGSVGMYGASNSGVPQWQVARHKPAALKAIVPHFTASELDDGWVWRGGAFQHGFNLWWTVANLAPDLVARAERGGADGAAARARLAEIAGDPDTAFAQPIPEVLGPVAPFVPHLGEWWTHGPGDPSWSATSLEDAWATIELPVLHIAGWYNVHLDGNLRNYRAMRDRGPESVRGQQHLLIGPWTQWLPALGDACGPDRRFPTALLDMEGLQLEWFAHHLADGPAPALPRARVFVMGADDWRDLDEWPPPAARTERWHLGPSGALQPHETEGAWHEAITVDPHDPVPTCGGATMLPNAPATAGQLDQRALLERDDVLVHRSEVLTEPVSVIGPVTAELWVTASVPSVDVTATLVDLHPDGRAMVLCDGVCRTALEPGAPTAVTVDLIATANVFLPGHRIGVLVAGANAPKYDRHPGHDQPYEQAVHLGAATPSALVLSLVPSTP